MSESLETPAVIDAVGAAQIYAGLMALLDAVDALKAVVVCLRDDIRSLSETTSSAD
jgi:hypothetical protein